MILPGLGTTFHLCVPGARGICCYLLTLSGMNGSPRGWLSLPWGLFLAVLRKATFPDHAMLKFVFNFRSSFAVIFQDAGLMGRW